jgi:hypothetical protein
MRPETTFQPEPRFAETVEFTLDDILTTEAEAARDAENLEAARALLTYHYASDDHLECANDDCGYPVRELLKGAN